MSPVHQEVKIVKVSCSRLVGTVGLLVGIACVGAAPAHASERLPRCSNGSLNGTFGFVADGVTLPTSPVPVALQGPL
jgi:hypothetical protein